MGLPGFQPSGENASPRITEMPCSKEQVHTEKATEALFWRRSCVMLPHLPLLLQRLIQDLLLFLQHPMQVLHLLLVLSCFASKVLLLFLQAVMDVPQLQCCLLLVPLQGRDSVNKGCCLLQVRAH